MKKIILIIGVLILAIVFIMAKSINSNVISSNSENIKTITLQVSIPCPGHASLIKNNINSLEGITNIEYTPITNFIVSYDSSKVDEQDILNLEIFKDYPAKKIN